jgi:hypothetical protein
VQNEEVIRDRILSVSTGFVKEYKPTAPARKRDDGLYEITILATVATNEVAQKLKENNLISGEVAGQNLYAEATTKVMNAEDAVAMLQAKFPELIKSCVTITPLNEEGDPMMVKDPSGQLIPSTQPAFKSENAEKKEITLTWLLEIGADKKYYKETLLPLVKQCMDAIAGMPAKEAYIPMEREATPFTNYGRVPHAKIGIPDNFKNKQLYVSDAQFATNNLILIKSISRNMDRCDYFFYTNPRNNLVMKYKSPDNADTQDPCYISIELLDEQDEIIAFAKQDCWNPFSAESNGDQLDSLSYFPVYRGSFLSRGYFNLIKVTMPIDNAKEIKNVRLTLGVNEPVFSLKSTNQ